VSLLLQTAALHFLKECVSRGHMYVDHIIQHRLLVPVVVLLKDIIGQDNSVHNAALIVIEAVQ
jgi:hypothetical protein